MSACDAPIGTVRSRSAAARLLEGVLGADRAGDLQVASHVIMLEDLLDLEIDTRGGPQPGLGADDARAQRGELLGGHSDVLLAPDALPLSQSGRPDPHQGPRLHRADRVTVHVPAIGRTLVPLRAGSVPDQLPGRGIGLDPLTEPPVLDPGARQDGHEAPAGTVDLIEIAVRAELRVSNILPEIRKSASFIASTPLPVRLCRFCVGVCEDQSRTASSAPQARSALPSHCG